MLTKFICLRKYLPYTLIYNILSYSEDISYFLKSKCKNLKLYSIFLTNSPPTKELTYDLLKLNDLNVYELFNKKIKLYPCKKYYLNRTLAFQFIQKNTISDNNWKIIEDLIYKTGIHYKTSVLKILKQLGKNSFQFLEFYCSKFKSKLPLIQCLNYVWYDVLLKILTLRPSNFKVVDWPQIFRIKNRYYRKKIIYICLKNITGKEKNINRLLDFLLERRKINMFIHVFSKIKDIEDCYIKKEQIFTTSSFKVLTFLKHKKFRFNTSRNIAEFYIKNGFVKHLKYIVNNGYQITKENLNQARKANYKEINEFLNLKLI